MKYFVNTEKTVISSQSQIYKTERFINETKHFSFIDIFISKIAEALILNLDEIVKGAGESGENGKECLLIRTSQGEHSFYVKLGFMIKDSPLLCGKDIVFYKYQSADKDGVVRRNDLRFVSYMRSRKVFEISAEWTEDTAENKEFNKLYILSQADYVNFPLLSKEQREIVGIEDQNVLAQGAAGSGKTNICISKIIFAARRGYGGKTLYTTFSRGLLIDTVKKVDSLKERMRSFIKDCLEGRAVFADDDRKKAVERRFGIYFTEDQTDRIIEEMKGIIDYLDNKVDYLLIEDLYAKYVSSDINLAGEDYFTKVYVKDIKNHQLAAKLNNVKHLSYEVIYKEIYGLIMGCRDLDNPKETLSLEEYKRLRKDGFSGKECEIIYLIAKDYKNHLLRHKLKDNNLMSRELLQRLDEIEKYSLAIIDEAQDMTEVNLYLMKNIAIKLFCVGDALQMINPSYFSFAYLKRLLYEKDITTVSELKHNYRNSPKIVDIIDDLGKINISKFGAHSFVLKGRCVESGAQTLAAYVKGDDFMEELSKRNFDGFTVVTGSAKEKEELRKKLKKQEILTVSEIKGLERDVVVLCNILSANYDKWQRLERVLINRKSADENSVYRYYFNLFYVGVSRAKSHLFVSESRDIEAFKDFFKKHFKRLDAYEAVERLGEVSGRFDMDMDEVIERITQFINLEQYDNARFAANKLTDDAERQYQLQRIDINEKYIRRGKYREAGIAYWELGRTQEAKEQFKLSKDDILIELVDACSIDDNKGLDIDILQFYPDVENNEAARKVILRTLQNDLTWLSGRQKEINRQIKALKER